MILLQTAQQALRRLLVCWHLHEDEVQDRQQSLIDSDSQGLFSAPATLCSCQHTSHAETIYGRS